MNGLWLTLIGAGILLASGLPARCGARNSNTAQRLACALMILGSLSGLAGVATALRAAEPCALSLPWNLPWGRFSVGLDALSAVFLLPVFTVPALGSVYGLGYWRQSDPAHNGRNLSLFYGLLAGALVMVVIARDSVLFLIAWEIMALSAFFLVSTDHENPEVQRAGWIYLVATHTGTLCLLALFALLRQSSGSFAFAAPDPGALTTGTAAALFILTLIGFGLKAGLMPLHVWLPGAHANAPSHVSAVLSGVVLNMGIYGLLRLLMLLPVPGTLWYGLLLLILGALSCLLGIVFAIGQSDIKRLLAYSSIENIGIITTGIGLALTGRTLHRPDLILLGLGGALLHLLNHSLFKPLLFFNSGAIIGAVQTRNINRMGGLGRSMPRTAALFLVGAVAICGLPPLNGFISEWLIYMGLFSGMNTGGGLAGFSAALAAVVLALTGALALACFVKFYGMVFLGQASTGRSAAPRDAALCMTLPMGLLAGGCAGLGLVPGLATPLLDRAVRLWAGNENLPETLRLNGAVPLESLTATGLSLAAAGLLLYILLRRKIRLRTAPRTLTWSCGYARPTARMQYTASSFTQMLTGLFRCLLAPKIREPQIRALFAEPSRFETQQDEPVLDRKILPAARLIRQLFRRARPLQQGLTHQYVIYLALMVIVLLLWILPIKPLFKQLFTP